MEKFEKYFTVPNLSGWRISACCICSTYHPMTCDIGKDPEFQKIYANRKQLFPIPTRK